MIKGFSVTNVLAASGVTLSPSAVWDSAGTTFTGIKFDVTDTASAAGSLLMDLQVGGVSRFSVSKSGQVSLGGALFAKQAASNYIEATTGWSVGAGAGNGASLTSGKGVLIGPTGFLGFCVSNSVGGEDTIIRRDAANTLAQRNGTNAQTSRIYGTFTDASNYRRVAIGMTTGGVASIAPEGAGTGASGNVLHISGLPTANPGPGILWNNGGTVEVGT